MEVIWEIERTNEYDEREEAIRPKAGNKVA